MLSNITLGQFFPGESIIHRLCPRTKLIAVFVLIVLIFIVKSWIGYLMLYTLLIIFIIMSKISFGQMLRGLKPLLFIMIFTFVINLFFNKEGNLIVDFYFIKITDMGLILALKLCLRLIFLITTTTLLTYTTSPIKLTDAIEQLFKPLAKIKFPVHEIAMMMTIAIRFIPTLIEETDKIMKAQIARGADFESKNIFKKALDMVPLLVPLFVSAFRRADELAFAMEARCYNGGEGRTKMHQLKLGKLDYMTFVLIALVIAAVAMGI
jgi:energy-coupling factor transport system permease protein